MPTRWVICPVVLENGVRRPKVATLVDPGIAPKQVAVIDDDGNPVLDGRGEQTFRTVFKTYRHSSAIDTADWCLSFVRGVDLSALDADPEIFSVTDRDAEDADKLLDRTPRELGWDADKLATRTSELTKRGAENIGVTLDTPLIEIVERLGKRHNPLFTAHGTWVS